MSLERRARTYIQAVEGGATGDELASFYHPDVVQHEMPNRLNPAGVRRDLAAILKAAESGQKVMARQIYDIHTVTETGDRVVLEFTWTGYANVPLGLTKAGDPIKAHIVQVLEFEDNRIVRQRTYDCFEAF
jgi:ketosteroid isomerase-like protein